ncbi:hypothetical protein GCM10009858_47120 [Terrabacter carboxydivorans]|uniref:Uncharacterized protein n=1 Tax=Terrabacter carboxydivorans TaxID=619730 RepID=A0ABN3MKP4_9MICO
MGGAVLRLSRSYALPMKPGHGVEVLAFSSVAELLPGEHQDWTCSTPDASLNRISPIEVTAAWSPVLQDP